MSCRTCRVNAKRWWEKGGRHREKVLEIAREAAGDEWSRTVEEKGRKEAAVSWYSRGQHPNMAKVANKYPWVCDPDIGPVVRPGSPLA